MNHPLARYPRMRFASDSLASFYMDSRQQSNMMAATTDDANQAARIRISSDDFLFSQTTIVSSVQRERGTHLIRTATSKFVNDNGEGFTNECLQSNYQSFVGAFNFLNHDQDPSHGVGFVADVALRKMLIDPRTQTWNYYADILVATDRRHRQLMAGLLGGDIKYLSMGCVCGEWQCSRCGKWMSEMDDSCPHTYDKGKYWIDERGQRRRTAEMLGTDEPGSLEFIEASWLTQAPAFGGAALRNFIETPPGSTIELTVPQCALSRPALQQYLG